MFSEKQNTIANEISFNGIGLHSAKEVNVNLFPAPDDYGIIFKRSDITDKNNIIPANYKNVTRAQLGTTLSNQDNVSVSTIEHFMAAIWGLRIDNLIIEMDGEEMPIVDGSSEPFVFLLESAGVKSQNSPSKILKITKDILFQEDGKKKKLKFLHQINFLSIWKLILVIKLLVKKIFLLIQNFILLEVIYVVPGLLLLKKILSKLKNWVLVKVDLWIMP